MTRPTPAPARHDRLPITPIHTTARPAADVAPEDRSAVDQFITFVNMTNGGCFAAARKAQADLRRMGLSVLTVAGEPARDDDAAAVRWLETLLTATRRRDFPLARIARMRLFRHGYSVAHLTKPGST